MIDREADEQREASRTTEVQTEGASTSTYRSVAELAADIGLSERSTRAALRRGEIPHIRLGRRFILPKTAIAEWLRTAGRTDTMSRPTKLALVSNPR